MKLIAITGKGVVSHLLKHHLMLRGHTVEVVPVALPVYAGALDNYTFAGDAYLDLIFNKESMRSELQEVGDNINERSSVLQETLNIIDERVRGKYDYILLDSWRATDSYVTLNNYCNENKLTAPHLITVGSNRAGIKGSGREHHKTEGPINDWPLHLRSLITNDVGTSYENVSLQVDHLIQTGRF